MTLQDAIKALGGVKATAAIAGIPRTTIHYWLEDGVEPPSWRAADVARIIALAKQTKRDARAA